VENPNIVIFMKGLDLGGYSGGADLFGANLACELNKNLEQVTLCICFKFNTEAERYALNHIVEKGITPIFLFDWNGHTNILIYFRVLLKLSILLKNLQVDIIHSHFHTGTLLSIILKLFRKVRWIVRTAHADQEWRRGWDGFFKQAIIRSLIFMVFPIFVDQEVGVSTYAVEQLNQRYIAKVLNKTAIVIPNAIPIHDGYQATIPQKRFTGWLGDRPIIGSVGRLDDQKGYKYLIDALPEILLYFPNLETWLIGDGPLKNELKNQCLKLGISDHVVFWGKQNNIPALLSRIDLFISSSLYEGLPTAVLEAMDFGVPCIVTDIPGTRDLIYEKNVLVVAAKDSNAMAKTIDFVLHTPSARRTMVEKSAKIMGIFRIDNISKAYLEVYREL
jgi:glycosyltransferase involved in cell wall biosynthesis